MSSIGDAIGAAVTAIPGLLIVAGLISFIYKRDAHLWEKLAAVYAADWREAGDVRRFQHAIAYAGGAAHKSYNGFLDISLLQDGFAIKPMKLFSLFHKPLFIPYKDVEGWRTHWYLNAKSIELTFAKAPEIKLAMPKDQVDWIASAARGEMPVRDTATPHDAKPHFWWWLAIVNGVLAVGVLAYVVWSAWPRLTG
jgi:hypothetical protein